MRPLPPALRLTFGLGLAFASAPALYAQDDAKPLIPVKAPEQAEAPDLELYRQGSLRLHQGDQIGAIERFTELLEKHPESRWAPEARFWRASALEESGRRQEALDAYRALRKLSPQSGWAKDAARRIERLARTNTPGQLKCQVQLKEGEAFAGRLHEVSSLGLLISGGPFKAPTRVAFDRLVKLEVERSAPRMLVLSNGDRVSGRLLRAAPEGVVLDVVGLEAPLRVPATRLRELRAPNRAGVAWLGTSTELSTLARAPHFGARAFAFHDEGPEEVERETRVNEDGSRTTTTTDAAGRKTITTVTRDGKGRKVLIKRGEGDESATIELKLDGGVVGEALLGDLAGELPEGLGEQLGDVDLDLDLEIDDSELRDLHEALKDLPEELRERIQRSLSKRKRTKRSRARRVWIQGDREGDERVIILEGDERPQRSQRAQRKKVVVVRGQGGKGEKHVVILEGDEARPRRVEKRVVILDGDEGPRRQKHVMVFRGDEDHGDEHGDEDGDEVEVEVEVEVFVTPEGKKIVRKRIRKGGQSTKRSAHGTFALREGDQEDVDVFVTPEGKRVVRKRVILGGGGRSFTLHDGDQEDVDVFETREGKRVVRKRIVNKSQGGDFARTNDFVFSPDSTHRTLPSRLASPTNNVYSWVHDEAHQTKDRVFLRNGDTLSGKIRTLDGEGLKLDTDYGKVTIRRDQIRQVSFATPKKPFLGVSMQATASGVEVTKVHEDSAAALAGFKEGDVIVQVGRERVQGAAPLDVEALGEEISKRRVGEVMPFLVRRGDKLQVIEARLAERPRRISATPLTPHLERTHALHLERARLALPKAKLHLDRAKAHEHELKAHKQALKAHEEALKGHEQKLKRLKATKLRPAERAVPMTPLTPATPAGKPRLGVALSEDDKGVVISQVMDGSLAARMGLAKGDRITKLQGKAVKSIADVSAGMKSLKPKGELHLVVERVEGGNRQVRELRVTLD